MPRDVMKNGCEIACRKNRGPGKAGGAFSGPAYAFGFTLVEILLALGMVSIIAGSLYGTYASAIQIQKKTRRLEQLNRSAFWSLDVLALDVESMVPYHQKGNGGEDADDFFCGEASRLTLLRPTEDGLKEVRYFLMDPDYGVVHKVIVGSSSSRNTPITLTQTDDGERLQYLVREEKLFPSEEGDSEESQLGEELEILNRYVQEGSLKFSYAHVARGAAGDDVGWETAWKKTEHPSLIRVEMVLVNPQDSEDILALQKDILVPLGLWK